MTEERRTELEGNRDPREAVILLAAEFGLSWSAVCTHLCNLDIIDQQVQKRLYSESPRRHDYLELGRIILDEKLNRDLLDPKLSLTRGEFEEKIRPVI